MERRLIGIRMWRRMLVAVAVASVGVILDSSVASADIEGEFVFSGVEDDANVAEFEVIFTLSEPVAPSLMVRVRLTPSEGSAGSLAIGFLPGTEGDVGDCGVNTPERTIATCEWPTPTAGEVGRPRLALRPSEDANGQWTIIAEASNTEIGDPPNWRLVTSVNIAVPCDSPVPEDCLAPPTSTTPASTTPTTAAATTTAPTTAPPTPTTVEPITVTIPETGSNLRIGLIAAGALVAGLGLTLIARRRTA